MPNLDVNWQQDTNGNDVILPASSKTNSDGKATIELKSTRIAVNNITVSARYDSSEKKDADKPVNFIQVSFSNLRVNGHNFNIDHGFPTTGFTDAKFNLSSG
ncbi:Ig-like domain-containing protein [Arsenophonus sp.]|uniref:Ig-like domain-containing protein n=1 Tax=Arsenophonus sp. TaxID=1872640 RepID=UPI003879EB28